MKGFKTMCRYTKSGFSKSSSTPQIGTSKRVFSATPKFENQQSPPADEDIVDDDLKKTKEEDADDSDSEKGQEEEDADGSDSEKGQEEEGGTKDLPTDHGLQLQTRLEPTIRPFQTQRYLSPNSP
ncbi:hypothetical protein Bca101_047604 [Brassica carinata]